MDDVQRALLILACARFWSKVDKRGPDDCWEWTASKVKAGYGQVSFLGVHTLAHRKAYELTTGTIPDGEGYHGAVVMHSCDNRACCNPAHLVLGTQRENVADMDAKGRGNRALNRPNGERHHAAVLTDEQRAFVVADKRGHSEVARELGISPQLVFWVRKAAKVAPVEDGRSTTSKGAANPASRLTDDDIRAIRASAEKPGAVAKQFGITPDYVTKIRKRLSWAHVE